MILQTTLCLAAAAIVVNIWLIIRISQVRARLGAWVGDGGQEPLIRRMRAQANFVENVPITLLLFGLVEVSGKGGGWLAPLGAVFLIGRVAHAFGMDGNPRLKAGRGIGAISAFLTQAVLAIAAVLIALGRI